MDELFTYNQAVEPGRPISTELNRKMDVNNLNGIEEKVILIKEAFEKIKKERDRLIEELRVKDEEISGLKNKISQNEAENDIIIRKVESIMTNLESIQL